MKKAIIAIVVIVVLFVINSGFYILNPAEQAIIVQFGKPIGETKTDAGLYFKTPVIQEVIKFDKRILEWDGRSNEIPTKDNKYIHIDAFARWRISDPLAFYKAVKNQMIAQSRLDDLLDGLVRDEITTFTLNEIIQSSERKHRIQQFETTESEAKQKVDETDIVLGARLRIMENILANVSLRLEDLNLGIDVVDVQFKRIDYNREVRQKVFGRMISEQNQIAEKYRASGEGEKQKILGNLDKRKKEVLSSAYLKSQEIKGSADAEAVQIYARTYGKSPEFFRFMRTLESYRETFDPSTKLILSTKNKYLKYLSKP